MSRDPKPFPESVRKHGLRCVVVGFALVAATQYFLNDYVAWDGTLPVLVLSAMLIPGIPLIVMWRYQRRIKRLGARETLCWNCMYNLRGLDQSSNCPECGWSISRSFDKWQKWCGSMHAGRSTELHQR